jgi:uncharacterized protein (TIGR03066 family)
MLQLGLVGCLVMCLTSSLAPAAKDDAKDEDAKTLIVGKWQPSDANQKVVIEFTKDNKIKMNFKVGEKDISLDGTYEFSGDDGKTIKMTVKNPMGGKDMTQTLKIKSISKEKMVISAQNRDTTFKRIK